MESEPLTSDDEHLIVIIHEMAGLETQNSSIIPTSQSVGSQATINQSVDRPTPSMQLYSGTGLDIGSVTSASAPSPGVIQHTSTAARTQRPLQPMLPRSLLTGPKAKPKRTRSVSDTPLSENDLPASHATSAFPNLVAMQPGYQPLSFVPSLPAWLQNPPLGGVVPDPKSGSVIVKHGGSLLATACDSTNPAVQGLGSAYTAGNQSLPCIIAPKRASIHSEALTHQQLLIQTVPHLSDPPVLAADDMEPATAGAVKSAGVVGPAGAVGPGGSMAPAGVGGPAGAMGPGGTMGPATIITNSKSYIPPQIVKMEVELEPETSTPISSIAYNHVRTNPARGRLSDATVMSCGLIQQEVLPNLGQEALADRLMGMGSQLGVVDVGSSDKVVNRSTVSQPSAVDVTPTSKYVTTFIQPVAPYPQPVAPYSQLVVPTPLPQAPAPLGDFHSPGHSTASKPSRDPVSTSHPEPVLYSPPGLNGLQTEVEVAGREGVSPGESVPTESAKPAAKSRRKNLQGSVNWDDQQGNFQFQSKKFTEAIPPLAPLSDHSVYTYNPLSPRKQRQAARRLSKASSERNDSNDQTQSVVTPTDTQFIQPMEMQPISSIVQSQLGVTEPLAEVDLTQSTNQLPYSGDLSAVIVSEDEPRSSDASKRIRVEVDSLPPTISKPLSPYALFFKDMQPTIKDQSPNATFGDVSKLVANLWENLSAARKQEYKRRTDIAKAEYLQMLAETGVSNISGAQSSSYTGSDATQSHQYDVISDFSTVYQSDGSQGNKLQTPEVPTTPGKSILKPSSNRNSVTIATRPPPPPPKTVRKPVIGLSGRPVLASGRGAPPVLPDKRAVTPPPVPVMCICVGCEKEAVEDSYWDNEYCSPQCVVDHCRWTFQRWVTETAGQPAAPLVSNNATTSA